MAIRTCRKDVARCRTSEAEYQLRERLSFRRLAHLALRVAQRQGHDCAQLGRHIFDTERWRIRPVVRTIGLLRTAAKIALAIPASHLSRLVWIQPRGCAVAASTMVQDPSRSPSSTPAQELALGGLTDVQQRRRTTLRGVQLSATSVTSATFRSCHTQEK